jgi:hypothetical protein
MLKFTQIDQNKIRTHCLPKFVDIVVLKILSRGPLARGSWRGLWHAVWRGGGAFFFCYEVLLFLLMIYANLI